MKGQRQALKVIAERALLGKKVTQVRYLTESEVKDQGWYNHGIVIVFDDGTFLLPMQDDEGNGPGAVHCGSIGEEDPTQNFVLPIL